VLKEAWTIISFKVFFVGWIPGVSTRIIWAPDKCTNPVILFRVVCGRLDVAATFWFTNPFKRVDFPTFGLPMMQAYPDLKDLDGFTSYTLLNKIFTNTSFLCKIETRMHYNSFFFFKILT
tara:strand:+ start:4 stop:363 length:360 start_codon:yes stop_codon:yes gene_type:complete